jgi:hypothetical protein
MKKLTLKSFLERNNYEVEEVKGKTIYLVRPIVRNNGNKGYQEIKLIFLS